MGDIQNLNMYAYCANNPVMNVDENGYLPSWLKIALIAIAVITVVAVTIATCGATSIAGTVVITGAINIVAQTATVAIAQRNYSKSEGDNSDEIREDVFDAVADSIDEIVLKTAWKKGTFASGTWAATSLVPSISASIQTAAIADASFISTFVKGGIVAYTKSPAVSLAQGFAYGFSAYYVSSTILCFFDEGYAYSQAEQYGWNPR